VTTYSHKFTRKNVSQCLVDWSIAPGCDSLHVYGMYGPWKIVNFIYNVDPPKLQDNNVYKFF